MDPNTPLVKITYKFYRKQVSPPTTLYQSSAMAESCKTASLTQEVIRRMKNTSEDNPVAESVSTINQFNQHLKNSGFSSKRRQQIITAGLVGYVRIRENAKAEGISVHRDGKSGKNG